ncbi:MAG: LCP family protein [Chloroflexota bacterium]|nr:LCP family protein [Chloroflexota bacterium]
MKSRRKEIRKQRKNPPPKNIKILTVLVFVILISVLGFILVSGISANKSPGLAYTYAMQTRQAMEQTQVTPTPFQPITDDDTEGDPEPITTREPGTNPETSPTSTVRVLQKPEGQVNYILLGSDARPDEGGFRTDIIVWVSLNPKDGFVSAISFPRDLYVHIPGYGESRINTAFPRGGFDLLADTFEENFGVRPDHYVMVDFNGFKSVINNLGGITVQTEKSLSDTCAKWINPSGYCSVGPGPVHMNGELALWYARSRYSTNDIDRARRSQEVIKAIFNRLMSLDIIVKAPDLYNAYTTYVDTDIKLSDVLTLLPLANEINKNGDIRSYVIGYDHAYDWMTMQGAQVLVPDYDKIRDMMIEALTLE